MIKLIFSLLNLKMDLYVFLILRSIFGLLTSFILFLIFGKLIIDYFNKINFKQKERKENILHKKKCNTPTTGGLIIIFVSIFSILIWSDLNILYTWLIILTLVLYGSIGLIDDLIKVYSKKYNGISIKCKYILQSIFTLFIIYLSFKCENLYLQGKIFVPFIKKKFILINKYTHYLLSYFLLVSSSNSVNLTDGLDGLAIISVIQVLVSSIIISLISSNLQISYYLNLIHLNLYELIIIISIIIGSALGFFWFNSYPSDIFMGDTGSLSLGGLLGVLFILMNKELLFIINGFLFFIETISVIIQIIFVRLLNRKFYLMAPIHHHYEIKNIHESKIVNRFCIISLIFNIISFLTIIIRVI